jgi:hypothetical protein
MTPDERLRVELELLEAGAPAGLPPNSVAVRSVWPRRLAQTAVVVAGLIVAAAILPLWLGRFPPLASLSPGPTGEAVLTWSVVPFAAGEAASPVNILSVGDRLILTGSDGGEPAAWYSDDDGVSWVRGTVHGLSSDPGELTMGVMTSRSGLLISLGSEFSTNWKPATWLSDDLGATWQQVAADSAPPSTIEVVVQAGIFVALGQGPNGVPGIWRSDDGIQWQHLDATEAFAGATTVEGLVAREGQLVAVGATLDESEAGIPTAWLSTDGREWRPIELSSGQGAALDIAADSDGYVAVGAGSTGGAHPVAWESPDGLTWSSTLLDSAGLAGAAHQVAANGAGYIAVGARLVTRTHGDAAWTMLVPGEAPQPLDVEAGNVSLVAHGASYVGLATGGGRSCGRVSACQAELIFGLPRAADAPPRSPIVECGHQPQVVCDDVGGLLLATLAREGQAVQSIIVVPFQCRLVPVGCPPILNTEFAVGAKVILLDGTERQYNCLRPSGGATLECNGINGPPIID